MTLPATRALTLTVETLAVDDVRDVLPYTDMTQPLLWSRGDAALAGWGEALRLEFTGPSRMTDAADAWRNLVDSAHVSDPVAVPGTGLLAFGAFAFAAESEQSSVLIVPRVVVGRRGDTSWVTRVRVGDETGRVSGASAGSIAEAAGSIAASVAASSAATSGAAAASAATSGAAALADTRTELGETAHIEFADGALSSEQYVAAVGEAVTRLSRGHARKVVLARDIVGSMPASADVRRTLEHLRGEYFDCYTYAVDGLIGASPETLVRVHGGDVASRVLAGTAARGADDAADEAVRSALAESAKDHEEHAYAVGSVLEALEEHCDELDASTQPFTLRLPNLWHLATDVHGRLDDDSSSLDLIAALHPTAAVAGTPTDAALRLIAELEPFDRRRYAGPVGWVGANGDGEWAIALRGAEIGAPQRGVREVRAFAGCGIVEHSVPERELDESNIKLRPITTAFA